MAGANATVEARSTMAQRQRMRIIVRHGAGSRQSHATIRLHKPQWLPPGETSAKLRPEAWTHSGTHGPQNSRRSCMKLGVMSALFAGMPLDDALDYCANVNLDAIELPVGGYPGQPFFDP